MEHIGQAIKQELERQERTVVWFARNCRATVRIFTAFFRKRV